MLLFPEQKGVKMKKINFEEAIEKLDLAVRRLESEDMPLDEAIDSFEEAIKLVKLCNEKLENAQQRVRILTESVDGTVTDEPFIQKDSDET